MWDLTTGATLQLAWFETKDDVRHLICNSQNLGVDGKAVGAHCNRYEVDRRSWRNLATLIACLWPDCKVAGCIMLSFLHGCQRPN